MRQLVPTRLRCTQPLLPWFHGRHLHTTPPTCKPFKIGDLTLNSNILLSPLERISDVGFRRLAHQNGAALTWTEMVYCSEFLSRGSSWIDTVDPDTPTGVQLLVDRTTKRDGWGTTQLQKALEKLEEGDDHWKNIVAVDLNFGCPAPAISRRGAGPAQLRRRSKIKALFETLVEWKNTQKGLPKLGAVGAKIRLGNTEREQYYKVYLPVAEAAAEVGLDYLTVHARNGEQRSSDPPTWDAIREIKDCVADRVPIIGNGDVRTHDDVQRMIQSTGCDGVMIGRAAMRNPWVFESLLTGKTEEWPTLEQLEAAFEENERWSNPQPAAARYQRFRHENFERLKHQATRNEDTDMTTTGSDWYLEWSQAATRRRHLDRIDDEGEQQQEQEGAPPRHGSQRRTSNARQWKKSRKNQQKSFSEE